MLKCLSVAISSQDGKGPSTDVIVLSDLDLIPDTHLRKLSCWIAKACQ